MIGILMLILDIAIRFLKEVLRLKITLVLLLGMPAFMGFMFAFAFGASSLGEAETYMIGIINNDDGLGDELANYLRSDSILLNNLPFNETTIDNGFAADFIDILNTSNYQTDEEKSEKRIFNVYEDHDLELGQKAVEDRQIDALIIFPENYSNNLRDSTESLSSIDRYYSNLDFSDLFAKLDFISAIDNESRADRPGQFRRNETGADL